MSAQDQVEDFLEELFDNAPDVEEPLLEIIICSASLPGYFDPWRPTQRPYVEIWEDQDFLASTQGYSAEHYETATDKDTSLRPEWNQRFVLRANGTKFYRFSVGLNFDLRARKVVGECGFAAADAWMVAAQAGGPAAVAMKLIRSGPQKKRAPKRSLANKTELFIADNSLLNAQSEGVGLRTEPRLDALTEDKDCVYWNRTVSAMRTDDPNWVKTKHGLFLPLSLNGVPVLRAEHETSDTDVLRLVLKFHPKANYRRFKQYLAENREEHNWYYWHKNDLIAPSYRSAVFYANQINPQDADAQPFGMTAGYVAGYQPQPPVQIQTAEPADAPVQPQNPFATAVPQAQMPEFSGPPATGMPCATVSAPAVPVFPAYPSSLGQVRPAPVPVFARPFEPEPAPGPPPEMPRPMATMSAPPHAPQMAFTISSARYHGPSAVEPMAEPGSSMRPQEFAVSTVPKAPSPRPEMRLVSAASGMQLASSQVSLGSRPGSVVMQPGSVMLAPPTDVVRSQSMVSSEALRRVSAPGVPVQSPVAPSSPVQDGDPTRSQSLPTPQPVQMASRQASFASQPAFAADSTEAFQATNDELKAGTDGLGFRQSMNIQDTPEQRDCVFWGNTVRAVRTSDPNWVRVPANGLYLPMFLHGIRVLKEVGDKTGSNGK